jgi:type IV pilus assembly protein PilO
MALLPQNPRDQKLMIIGVLFIGLAAVYQQMYWTPKNDELNLVAVKLDTLDSLNAISKREVAKGTANRMKAEGAAYSRELAVLRHLVPTTNEVPPLLESISNSARRAGLEVSEFAPDGVVNGDQFDTYKYKLGVSGPYHRVSEFLTNVASLPRIVSPINVTAAPSSRINSELRPKRGEQLLDVKFGVQTYVAHVQLPKPAAPKTGSP